MLTGILIVLALATIITLIRRMEFQSCIVKAKIPCQHFTLEYDYTCEKCCEKVFVDYV